LGGSWGAREVGDKESQGVQFKPLFLFFISFPNF
jgi:hypothetical protein